MNSGKTEATHLHTCPLCEACCNLKIETRGREVLSVRGDPDDSFSRGYICPKGVAVGELDRDPDRLRTPLVKKGGQHVEATWEEAFAEIDRHLPAIAQERGAQALAIYLGNPSAHHMAHGFYGRALIKALGSRNRFTASTVDQMPKQVSSGLMFGSALSVPIPDVDRTNLLWVLGANPLVSNGSLMTAPDMKRRLRELQERGGKIIVFDPRRSRTAEIADEHHFIRPGRDALFLLGVLHTLVTEGLAAPGRLADLCEGMDQIESLAREFSPEAVAPGCGIAADEIRRLARELAGTESAAVYARIGTCTQEFGTVTSWLVDVVNVITGNLDRVGGSLFARAATGPAIDSGRGRGLAIGRWASRVSKHPEACGEIPVACMAEEIETPGDGQIRALITVCGNPALSTPNGARLRRALESLDFMVSVDIYLNETTRHANVILPGLSPLEQSHYPLGFSQLCVRDFARYSPAVFDVPDGQQPEWRILLRLAGILAGQGPACDVDALDDLIFEQALEGALAQKSSPIHGRDAAEIRRQSSRYCGPERLLDLTLRNGPYGDAFGANPGGLSLATLAATGRAVDLGALKVRLPGSLRTPSGRIELAPEALLKDLERLRPCLSMEKDDTLLLVGRRDLRSNNSWLHNLPSLVSGSERCTLHLHPDDAAMRGLDDGRSVRVSSAAGSIEVPLQITADVMRGVASLPHGWGHDDPHARLHVAAQRAGASSNDLTDEQKLDIPSGNAILNGIPITIESL